MHSTLSEHYFKVIPKKMLSAPPDISFNGHHLGYPPNNIHMRGPSGEIKFTHSQGSVVIWIGYFDFLAKTVTPIHTTRQTYLADFSKTGGLGQLLLCK